MAILKGLAVIGITIGYAVGFLYLAGNFTVTPLPLGGVLRLLFFILPLAGGLKTGWVSGGKALKQGAALGLLIWVAKYAALLWLAPVLIIPVYLGGELAYLPLAGAMAAGLGFNLRLARV